jgi:hypothetical protein
MLQRRVKNPHAYYISFAGNCQKSLLESMFLQQQQLNFPIWLRRLENSKTGNRSPSSSSQAPSAVRLPGLYAEVISPKWLRQNEQTARVMMFP